MQSIFDDDLSDARKKFEDASSGDGIFIKLKNDEDSILCVLMEEPQLYQDEYDGKQRKRAKANFAVFEGDKFLSLKIWDCAPKHMNSMLRARKEQGSKKLYKLTRDGKARDPKTTYSFYAQRDLTPSEMEKLHKVELLTLTKPEEVADGAKEEVAKQIQRLGWTMEQYEVANVKHFGEKRETKDMMVNDRVLFIAALVKMAVGADPTTIGAEATLDLDEDAEFF